MKVTGGFKRLAQSGVARGQGFALIVTLSLMILLTVIAVGLLTFSSISLRATSSGAAMAEARQNARMALILVIGELQKNAGPDQRITATADSAGDDAGLPLTAGAAPGNDKSINGFSKGLSPVEAGTRWWTGVWKNVSTSITPAVDTYTQTPSPKFVQWLVSGNETAVGTVNQPASPACAIGAGGKIEDPKTAVVLVGGKTVGEPSADTLVRYVAVPLVPINRAAGTAGKLGGRYGWWIGDEGVKAKINIPTTTNTDPESYASLSAQRRGWETIAGFENYPTTTTANQTSLARIISVPSTALAVPGTSVTTGGASPLQAVFHSATADSRAVIADTLSGGTKVDLTAFLNGDLPATNPVPTIANYQVKDTTIVPRGSAFRAMKAPTWDTLREFYDQSALLQSVALIVKPAATVTGISLAPLVTDLRILMGLKFKSVVAGSSVKANACGKFAVAIANPYSRPLKWEKELEFEVRDITPPGNLPSRIWNLKTNSVFISANEPAVFNQAIFRIKPDSLEPGEARAYTLAGATLRAIGSGTQRVFVDLAPFGSARPSSPRSPSSNMPTLPVTTSQPPSAISREMPSEIPTPPLSSSAV